MASLSAERQQKILELLQERKTLKTREVVEQLQVSPMTVHRDLGALAEAGLVNKVHGGVTLAGAAQVAGASPEGCALCGRPVSARTAFVIRRAGGQQVQACCPHCGLLLLATTPDGALALTTDFLDGQMTGAQQAAYLVESEVTTCCAPSVLTFSRQREALRFQLGFGGQVMDMNGARQYLQAAMALDAPSHSVHERRA